MIIFVILTTLLSTIVTLSIRNFAIKFSIVNNPNSIVEQHKKPIAYLGGVALFLSFILNAAVLNYFNHSEFVPLQDIPWTKYFLGLLLFLFIGVVDDLKPFSPFVKFVIQFLIAVGLTFWGLELELFRSLFVNQLVSVFLIVLFVNAVNLTDVCDGLVASVIIVALAILILFFSQFSWLFLILLSAYIGFLVYNAPQASIFMGDAGSHLSGFLLFCICHVLLNDMEPNNKVLLIFGLPSVFILELSFLIYTRSKKGLKWWHGSSDHFSLRYQKAGVSRWKIDVIAAVLNGCLLLFAISFSIRGFLHWISGIVLFAIVFFLWNRTLSIGND